MIENISIKNYRNLKELEIPSLGRVNLIAGMNNSGKTSLLEAVSIFLAKADWQLLLELLENREGKYVLSRREENSLEEVVEVLSTFFHNWTVSYFDEDLGIKIETSSGNLAIQFVKYSDERDTVTETGRFSRRRILITEDMEHDYPDSSIGLKITYDENEIILPFAPLVNRGAGLGYSYPKIKEKENFRFVKTQENNNENESLWDRIILSPNENTVIEALCILEPNIERLAFVNQRDNSRIRIPVVTLNNSDKRIALSSMGDGINKVLKIILSLVNSVDGYLIIDEFENGLHHTSQVALWKIIFEFAYKYNVQVFATTHSYDSVNAFGKVANGNELYADSKYFRLDNKDERIVVVEYESEVVKIATEQGIETR